MGIPVTVIVPSSTAESVRQRIASFGATVEVHGSVWDEADQYARQLAEDPGNEQKEGPPCHVLLMSRTGL